MNRRAQIEGCYTLEYAPNHQQLSQRPGAWGSAFQQPCPHLGPLASRAVVPFKCLLFKPLSSLPQETTLFPTERALASVAGSRKPCSKTKAEFWGPWDLQSGTTGGPAWWQRGVLPLHTGWWSMACRADSRKCLGGSGPLVSPQTWVLSVFSRVL